MYLCCLKMEDRGRRCLHLSYFLALFICGLLLSSPVTCAGRRLRMVNVVYRHGDRSPAHVLPNDEHVDYWPQGMGQLTQIGMRQEYGLGKFLKSRYVENFGLLNSSYIHKDLYIRSSDADRCLMSAQTQLNGLYPPHGNQIWRDNLDWQPIGIHVVKEDEDFLLRPMHYNCPRFDKMYDEGKNQDEYQKMQAQYSDMLAYVSKNSGHEIDVSTAYKVMDVLVCEKSHGLPLPAWAENGTTYEDMKTVCDFKMYWNFNTPEKARLTGGPLVGRMIENMQGILGSNPLKKIYIYSAHDRTLAAFMSAMLVFDRIVPEYSSAVMLELYSDENDPKKDLTVQIQYRFGHTDTPRLLKLPQCAEDCPLDEFIKLTADYIPKDIEKECSRKEECSCDKDWKSEGCFKDHKKVNKKIFPKTFGIIKKIKRKNPDVDKIFDECSKMAEEEGYEIFAIQNVNRCVTSADGKPVDFKVAGESPHCITDDHGHGVGKKKTSNFVYTG